MDGIGNGGGIQEMSLKWMKNIDRTIVQIDILSYNKVKPDNFRERVAELGGNVYIIESFQDKGKFWKSITQTRAFFSKHKDYDILHAHASSKALFILMFAALYGIKRRILHSHTSRIVVRGFIGKFIATVFRRPALFFTTDYFACSKEAGEFLFGKIAIKRNKVNIVHNAVDLTQFKFDSLIRENIRNEIMGNEKHFLIGNVGRFMLPKNHHFLLKIYAETLKCDPSIRLCCVGNGGLEGEIHQKAKDMGIYDKIYFLGFRDDVKDVMQSFDLLLMPSLFEGLPVTGVEAQAVGVPVLYSDTITKDAAILPSSSFMSLNDSPEVWAKKILSYKNMKHEADPHKWIREKGYDIVIETKKLQQYYENCVEKR